MPFDIDEGGGSRDIGFGGVIGNLHAYFWTNCVAKAGNQNWDNGVYNAGISNIVPWIRWP